MTYDTLLSGLAQYRSLYEDGLKKAANAGLDTLCAQLEALPEPEFSAIVLQLTADLCDTARLDFLTRTGTGQLPHRLKAPILRVLTPLCAAKQVPALRRFRQLFRDDPAHGAEAYRCLEEAFSLAPDDAATAALMFEALTEGLQYALHEIPSGLLCAEEEIEDDLRVGEGILAAHTMPPEGIARFRALEEKYHAFRGKA